ncbi:MAG TPA: aquaporin [Intrasporangium sp.]|uniref:aquaporin n=1 Tax=Intrasporangium sp. TaxID=1925024 RepID=UPI002B49FFDD|nr:aquaporin [Intrasporangium sp.]HKX66599.1 aquaporin [Intrasporangium sp.]
MASSGSSSWHGGPIFNGKVATQALYDGAAVHVGVGRLGIALAFGLVVTCMIYAVGRVSHGHINPAVTDRAHDLEALRLVGHDRVRGVEQPTDQGPQLCAIRGSLGWLLPRARRAGSVSWPVCDRWGRVPLGSRRPYGGRVGGTDLRDILAPASGRARRRFRHAARGARSRPLVRPVVGRPAHR